MKLSIIINRGFLKVYINFNIFVFIVLLDNVSFFVYKFILVRVIMDLKLIV